jgi:uncharacterized membrane protein
VGLAIIGLATAALAAASGGGPAWLFAGGLLASVIPYTLLLILPTVRKLQDSKLDPTSKEAKALLSLWHRLHHFRTVVSIAAFGMMVALK